MYQRAAIKLPRIPNSLPAEAENDLDSKRHQLIRQEKEQGCEERHRQHEAGRNQGFAAAWPCDFCRLGPYLLQELERVCFRRHLTLPHRV